MTQLALPLAPARRLSDTDRVLRALEQAGGEWTELSYARLGCMIHSRVSDIRKRGRQVECRRNGERYEYRLVNNAAKGGSE